MSEAERMAYVRQHLMNAMGMNNNQYVYQTDMGREANLISDEKLREMITSSNQPPS